VRGGFAAGGTIRALAALVALVVAASTVTLAQGERTQYGNLIVSLDGGLSPLTLPRERPAPVTVHLRGALSTADGTQLPRVTRIELGLPSGGALSTKGLPLCSVLRLTNTSHEKALRHCRGALVGQGRIEADVLLPNQRPFRIHAPVLAFNGRVRGQKAVLLHAISKSPPTVVVIPFLVVRRPGRFGMALVADLPTYLGPWPHFARFDLTLSRRYLYRGQARSYLNARCPIPPRWTAGFFSLAKATFTLAGGREVSTGIARGCRAR
jgi:hypothetical protein